MDPVMSRAECIRTLTTVYPAIAISFWNVMPDEELQENVTSLPREGEEEGVSIGTTLDAEALQQWKEELEQKELAFRKQQAKMTARLNRHVEDARQELDVRASKVRAEEDQLAGKLARVETEHRERLIGHTDAIAMTRIKAARIASHHAAFKNCGNWSLNLVEGEWKLHVESVVDEAPPRRTLEDGFMEYIPWRRPGVNSKLCLSQYRLA
jgi:hypothetical protein